MKKGLLALLALVVIGLIFAFFFFRYPVSGGQAGIGKNNQDWFLIKGPATVWSLSGGELMVFPLEDNRFNLEATTSTLDLDSVALELVLDLEPLSPGQKIILFGAEENQEWDQALSTEIGKKFTTVDLREVLVPNSGGPLGAIKSLQGSSFAPLVESVTITNPTEAFQAKALAQPLLPLVQQQPPLVVIGWDGGDWQTVDPLLKAGELPNLQDLLRRGVRAPMRSRQPMLSPLLWTSMATGLSPDEHGIMDFLVKDPVTEVVVPITSGSREAPALWNMVAAAGKKPAVFAWWATYPAEPIDGVIVTDRAYYSLFDIDPEALLGPGLTHPPGFLSGLGFSPLQPEDMTMPYLKPFIPSLTEEEIGAAIKSLEEGKPDDVAHLMKILSKTINYHRIAMATWQKAGPFDFFSPYYEAVDEIGHRFMHFVPPLHPLASQAQMEKYGNVVPEMYRLMDVFLGDLVAQLPGNAQIMLISDHGFKNGTNRPRRDSPHVQGKPGLWHRTHGMFVLASDKSLSGVAEDTVLLEEICPTSLALMGMPIGEDMEKGPASHIFKEIWQNKEWATVASYKNYCYPYWKNPTKGGALAGGKNDQALLEDLIALGYVSGDALKGLGDSDPTLDPNGDEIGQNQGFVEGDPTDNTWLNQAGALIQKGDHAGAEDVLREGLDAQPNYIPLHSSLMTLLVDTGRPSEAFDYALGLLPRLHSEQRGEIILIMVESGIQADRMTEAIDGFQKFSKNLPESESMIVSRGSLLEAQEQFVAAMELYENFLKSNPDAAKAFGHLFNLMRADNRETELLPLLDKMLIDRPDDPTLLAFAGICNVTLRNYSKARGYFERALAQNPDHVSALINLGVCLSKMGQDEKAIDVLEKALKKDDQSVEGWLELGVSYAKEEKFDQAKKAFEKALALEPNSGPAAMGLAISLAQTGQRSKAIQVLEKAIEKNPDMPQLKNLLMEIS